MLARAARVARAASLSALVRGGIHRGECPICEGGTLFVKRSEWLRDHYFCARCGSVPRFRALVRVLAERFPGWRDLAIHESSPAGAASAKLAAECGQYVATHYFLGAEPGSVRGGFRCEDLERQTFGDAAFDLVITQDVLEHVLDPGRAFAEIARTMRPGGAHVFTVPWYYWRPTLVRARHVDGTVIHDHPPEYHGNPIDPEGSLVVTEWGSDLLEFIERTSGMRTSVEHIFDPRQGICGEFRDVFISRRLEG